MVRSLTWLPIWLGVGIIASMVPFSISSYAVLLIAIIGVTSLSMLLTRYADYELCFKWAAWCCLVGFLCASYRHYSVASPIIHDSMKTPIVGRVASIEPRPKGYRLILYDVGFPDVVPEDTPKKVRISTYERHLDILVGDRIRCYAKIMPPPKAREGQHYDFSFYAYYDQMGGVGYALSKIRLLDRKETISPEHFIERVRQSLLHELHAQLGDDVGPVASAITVGETHAISPAILDAMRGSGLAHILSVSGMHLSMMALIGFWMTRWILCLWMGWAVGASVKQWSAIGGMVLSGYYLLISGMQVAAIRAWCMVFAVLIAILLDRRILSFPCLALAATAILLYQPEKLFHPSFQMSFAAVLGLIAWGEYAKQNPDKHLHDRYLWEKSLRYIKQSAQASLVASLATAPFAIYHFQQQALYSVLANVLVVPAISCIVMPSMVCILLLFPISLASWPIYFMGKGLDWMIWIADTMYHMPGAQLHMPPMNHVAFICSVVALLLICIGNRCMCYGGFSCVGLSALFYYLF